MGLDIYVGSLTRYYAGDWETVVQRHARETGVSVRVVRSNESEDAVTDPQVIRSVLRNTEMWLPADFDFTFAAEDLSGSTVNFGSVIGLRDLLTEINYRRWRAD